MEIDELPLDEIQEMAADEAARSSLTNRLLTKRGERALADTIPYPTFDDRENAPSTDYTDPANNRLLLRKEAR